MFITDSAERAVHQVNNDVLATIRLSLVARDCNRKFVSRWKIPAVLIAVLAWYGHIFTPVFLEKPPEQA